MKLERRDFLKYIGTSTFLTTLPIDGAVSNKALPDEQKLHQDYQSNNKGTEYYFIGNGLITGALQTSASPESGTHCGLLVMSPEHFGRKISTYLYHPERGLQNSRPYLVYDRRSYSPEFSSSKVSWDYPENVPTLVVQWQAGDCSVREELVCPSNDPVIIRTITITNNSQKAIEPSITALLYPNLMFFDEYSVDRTRGTLTADGYQTLRLFSSRDAAAGDRHLSIALGSVAPGGSASLTLALTLDYSRESFEKKGLDSMMAETRKRWASVATMETGHKGLDHLFRVSTSGIRTAVARSGKTDGSIWQYNLEWVRDQSMVAAAAAMAGQTEIGAAILRRILTRSVDETGRTVDASRHRPPETMELDQNGALLSALSAHWLWSGSDAILRDHWSKIKNVADYVLQPIFMDASVGLVKNSREFWERDPGFGVKEGFENTYQLWNIVGLEKASEMASAMGDPAAARRWNEASRQMKKSFIGHPRFSLVDNGHFIKRRLSTGEVQRTFEPPSRASMPKGMPLNVESVSYCDPDAANVLPIALEVVDPRGSLSLKTLESVEELWNQRWNSGGYARYHVSSEPDSPGPWPFATLFIARAYHEAGNHEKVWRALQWLLDVQGGAAGAWLEYYGERPTPPLPPVGIVVWTWAELITFFVHHLLGVRPSSQTLTIRPRLLTGLEKVAARIPVRGRLLSLNLVPDTKGQWASVNGKRVSLKDQSLDLPLPQEDLTVEMHVRV